MADMEKSAEGLEGSGRGAGYGHFASEMKIEEAQGELDPGEAVIRREMEVEADMQLQAALEEKQKAEEKLKAALAEKQEAEAKLKALEEKMEAEAKLKAGTYYRDGLKSVLEPGRVSGFGPEPEPDAGFDYEAEAEAGSGYESKSDDGSDNDSSGDKSGVHSEFEDKPDLNSCSDNPLVYDIHRSDNKAPYDMETQDQSCLRPGKDMPIGRGRSRAKTSLFKHNRHPHDPLRGRMDQDSAGAGDPAKSDTQEEKDIFQGRSKRSRRKNAGAVHISQEKTHIPKSKAGSEAAAAIEGEESNRMSIRGKKIAAITVCTLAIAVLLAGGAYAAAAQKYKRVFFPNTTINGMDASGMTVAEAKERLTEGIQGYVLTIEERGGKQEQITGEEIRLRAKFDGSLEQVVTKQNPYAWLSYKLNPAEYTIDTMVEYDEEALEQAAGGLDCMNPEFMTEPENAVISDYIPGQGYTILPQAKGTVVLPDVLKSSIADSVINMRERLSLEEAGAYKEPEIGESDPALRERLDAMNRFISTTVTYRFGDKTEVLSGDRTHDWLEVDEGGNITVDEAKAAAYVEELAVTHNTANKAKNIKTSYGQTIQVKGGTYGWKINQSEETAELIGILRSGQSQEREPVYSQKGASRGEKDYGDTYVEINLTAQHLFFYKNGSLLVESDFVSGNLSRGWGTPAGSFPLTYKQRNATLKGEGYRTPVDYWMPFNGGIGMHDAKWRGAFGGTIYKTGGSHGCINLPHAVAKKIYENISAGMPVICYNLEGTEKGTSTAQPPQPPVTPPTEAPVELPTEAPVEPPIETPAPPPETTAPSGPGSDPNLTGEATGPGGGPQ